MVGAGEGATRVLLICPQGEERKRVLEALEPLPEFEVNCVAMPAAATRQAIEHDLLLVWLGFDAESTQELIDHATPVPVLGLLPADEFPTEWSWHHLPEGLSDCLSAGFKRAELRGRMARLVRGEASAPKAANVVESEDDVLFEGVADPLCVSDPKSGQILRVNEHFVQAMGEDESYWLSRRARDIGLHQDDASRKAHQQTLENEGHVAFQTQLPDGRWVEVRRSFGVHQGRLVYLTHLRFIEREINLARGLRLLPALFPTAEHAGGSRIAEIVGEWLDLDYFMLAALRPQKQVRSLVAHSRGAMAEALTETESHLPYRKLLVGQPVLVPDNAEQAIGRDKFVQTNKIRSYVGLPVYSSQRKQIGVLIAASKNPLPDFAESVGALRVVAGFFGLQMEVQSMRRQSEAEGLHDSLTKLPNRILFHDRLEAALRDARRTGEKLALMFVDLDRFKTINDSLGHDIGDEVLLAVSDRLKRSVRKSDTVARFAGDEFTALVRHVKDKQDVVRIAEALNASLAQPLGLSDGQELQITASIGVSFFPEDGINSSELLKRADQAMYGAKGMGRNTFQAYSEEPGESQQQQKLMLESKLRHAEENGELRVFYQPQVATETEDIIGMEALIRWEHPELGLISPGFFIPLAEETGLIVPIGEWLLRKACRQARAWQERFGLPLILGVNLSPLQLRQPELIKTVESALNDAGLAPEHLDLEVTESLSIKSIPGLRERLEAARQLGCKISIDDFGTGQASLDYLRRFPADRIKVDQSFIRNIGIDPDDEAIVKATIEMAHSLNLGVIAEGVEEEHHLEFLRDHNCEELQGYLFSRPLPAAEFGKMLEEREEMTQRAERAS